MEQSGYGLLTVPEIFFEFFGINNSFNSAFSFLKKKSGVLVEGNFIPDMEKEDIAELKEWLKDEYNNPRKLEFFIDFEYKNIQLYISGMSTNYIFIPCDKSEEELLEIFNKLNHKKN